MMFIKNKSLKERLLRAIYMDDIQVGSKGPHENMDELITETEQGLKQANFHLKSWNKTGDQSIPGGLKYLSYNYHSFDDKISLRFTFNMSKKKRGVREGPDFHNLAEFEEQIKMKPLTKRGMASLLAGVIYDPLGLTSCYLVNLKIAYRRICRYAQGWEDEVKQEEVNIVRRTMR